MSSYTIQFTVSSKKDAGRVVRDFVCRFLETSSGAHQISDLSCKPIIPYDSEKSARPVALLIWYKGFIYGIYPTFKKLGKSFLQILENFLRRSVSFSH